MRKILCSAVALLALNLLLGNVSHAQNKAARKKNAVKQEDPTPADYATLRKMKEISGTLTYVDLGTNKLNLRVEIPKQVPNTSPQAMRAANAQQQALLRAQQQLMRDYQNIMNSRNPAQQQQRMQKLLVDYQNLQIRMVQAGMGQANLVKTVTTAKEFEFEVAAEPRVARVELPVEYDEKGNEVKYTKEELKKKKDTVLPGYSAQPDELQPGQKVKLYLEPRKKAAKKKTGTDKADANAEKSEANQKKEDPKTTKNPATGKTGKATAEEPPPPLVRMVLIYSEPDASTLPQTDKKKKKKDNNN